eukprot:TRINITY_DN12706_c0_g1_i1.p1 TRINITY_DN12706_c0_g1~~TRINITY_DN12706_c0_g1_i1.p1  ORF type:complete len:356 (+),score=62.46 TRINITY_DN12706_c0_g1_i1:1-1068(+)
MDRSEAHSQSTRIKARDRREHKKDRRDREQAEDRDRDRDRVSRRSEPSVDQLAAGLVRAQHRLEQMQSERDAAIQALVQAQAQLAKWASVRQQMLALASEAKQLGPLDPAAWPFSASQVLAGSSSKVLPTPHRPSQPSATPMHASVPHRMPALAPQAVPQPGPSDAAPPRAAPAAAKPSKHRLGVPAQHSAVPLLPNGIRAPAPAAATELSTTPSGGSLAQQLKLSCLQNPASVQWQARLGREVCHAIVLEPDGEGLSGDWKVGWCPVLQDQMGVQVVALVPARDGPVAVQTFQLKAANATATNYQVGTHLFRYRSTRHPGPGQAGSTVFVDVARNPSTLQLSVTGIQFQLRKPV